MVGGADDRFAWYICLRYAPVLQELGESILRDQKSDSMLCPVGRRIWSKGYLHGVPVVIGKNGVESIIDYKLNDEEKALFEKSATAVRNMNNVLKELGVLA